jgi:hypothetical protein
MSLESADAWRAWIAEVAAADPRTRRFGARQHGYRVDAPLGDPRVRALEEALALRLPADHRAFVATISGGGAGPYHGLLPLEHPVQARCAAGTFPFTAAASLEEIDGLARSRTAIDPVYAGVIALGHVGCGHVALLVVRGAAAGQVWIDARDAGLGVGPIAPSFRAYVQDWIERTSRNLVPRPLVPPGACALAITLSSYLAQQEAARGLAQGAIDDRQLREALAAIGPRAIAIEAIADRPCFARGDRLDPCPSCEVLLENLRGRGLGPDTVAPGLPPLLLRG